MRCPQVGEGFIFLQYSSCFCCCSGQIYLTLLTPRQLPANRLKATKRKTPLCAIISICSNLDFLLFSDAYTLFFVCAFSLYLHHRISCAHASAPLYLYRSLRISFVYRPLLLLFLEYFFLGLRLTPVYVVVIVLVFL